jgi:hypothetical protein
MTCVPICFCSAPAAAASTVPPGAAGAPLAALNSMVAGSAE